MQKLTEEMEFYINQYPPATQNNSRSLLRKDMLRLLKKGKVGVQIMQDKYGFNGDYIPGYDDGERPEYNNHE